MVGTAAFYSRPRVLGCVEGYLMCSETTEADILAAIEGKTGFSRRTNGSCEVSSYERVVRIVLAS